MPFRSTLLLSAALAPALTAAASAQSAQADPADPDDVIIVTGTARGADRLSTPADVDVAMLSGALKDSEQETSLGRTLDYFAGVDTIGAGDQVGKPVIRGLSGNRIRVLSDGIGLDFQQFGVRHPPNVDPYIAERIEVVRGASSILYGSDAIGGAVNVISNRPPSAPAGRTRLSGRVTGVYQSAYRQGTGALSLQGANGPLGFSSTLVYRDSGGLVTPDEPDALETGNPRDPLTTGDVPFSGFEQINGDVSLGYETPRGPVVLRYEAYRNEHDFVVPDPPPPNGNPLQPGGVGQDLENDLIHLFARLDVAEDVSVRPSLAYSRNLRVSNPGPPEPLPRDFLPDAAVLDILRENYTDRLELDHGPVAGLAGRVGAEIQLIDQESRGPVALTPGGRIEKFAVFGLEELQFGDLIVNIGARFDHITTEGDPDRTVDESGLPANPALLENDYSVATGSLGLVYRVSEALSLTASVGRGFRAPTLFELYADGVHGGVAAIQRGDPAIGEETSLSYDASIRYDGARAGFNATAYFNDVADYIFLAGTGMNAPNGLPIFQVSQQDAELAGLDLEARYEVSEAFSVRGVIEYVDGELGDGRQIPLLPPLKATVSAQYDVGALGAMEAAYVKAGLEYADSQDSAGLLEPFGQFDAPPPPFGTASTDSYTLVNASAGGSIGAVDFEVSVDNILDEPYRDFLDTYKNVTLSPGRNIRLRASYAF